MLNYGFEHFLIQVLLAGLFAQAEVLRKVVYWVWGVERDGLASDGEGRQAALDNDGFYGPERDVHVVERSGLFLEAERAEIVLELRLDAVRELVDGHYDGDSVEIDLFCEGTRCHSYLPPEYA
jgi:hypothetical protein